MKNFLSLLAVLITTYGISSPEKTIAQSTQPTISTESSEKATSEKIISIDLNLTEKGYEKNKEALDSLSMKYPEVQLHVDATQSTNHYFLYYSQTTKEQYGLDLENAIIGILITINFQESEIRLPPKKGLVENGIFETLTSPSYKDSIDVQRGNFNLLVLEVHSETDKTEQELLEKFQKQHPDIKIRRMTVNDKLVICLIFTAEIQNVVNMLNYFLTSNESVPRFRMETYNLIEDKPYYYQGWKYDYSELISLSPKKSSPQNSQEISNALYNNANTKDDISIDFNVQYWAITVGAAYTDKKEALRDVKSFNALSPQMGTAKFKVVALENGLFSIVYNSNEYSSKNEAQLEMADVKNLVGNVYPQLSREYLIKNHTVEGSDEDCACNLKAGTVKVSRQAE